MKNSIKRILCIALCICTVFALALTAVSCKKEEEEAPQDEPKEGEIAVVRVVSDMKKGEKLTSENVYIDYVTEEKVHFNAIRELEKAVGKYLRVDVVAGDYLFAGKLEGDINTDNASISAYISVKDYVREGEDCTSVIQNLIYENSGRTLYFPDGTYIISKPIVLSADSITKVSLELSDFAVIKAADSWSSEDAMICIGANDIDIDEAGAGAQIEGGIIDGSGKAKGIAVLGARDSFISSVSIKNATVGLVLGGEHDTRTTVENINIVCGENDSFVGMEILSNSNAFENVLIDGPHIGVKLTGKNNILKNIRATYNGSATTSIGFEDNGKANNYDICFSENYSTGFYMGAEVKGSVYVGCYTFWNNDIEEQTAYRTEASFNATVRSCRADFDSADAVTAYLLAGEENGTGRIVWPLIKNVDNIDGADHEIYLGDTLVVEIAE